MSVRRAAVVFLMLATLTTSLSFVVSANDPVVVITSSVVSCADPLRVTGAGFVPGSEVIVSTGTQEDVPGSVFGRYWGPVAVDADGVFEITGIKPILSECIGLPPEPHFLTVSTVTGGSLDNAFGPPLATASFAVEPLPGDPRLELSPAYGSGCLEVVARGENFEPGTAVVFWVSHFPLGDSTAQLGEASVDDDGSFSFDVPPAGAPFISCEGFQQPPDGQRYLVSASTVDAIGSNQFREPSAAYLFTIQQSPAERFSGAWQRTDLPVAEGIAGRTWIWGDPRSEVLFETYAESPGGMRTVQYFDKSRMEVTDPDGDRGGIWYITNGLLVVELISGEMQVGDQEFVSRSPSEIPVAGDNIPQNGPSYAAFQQHLRPVDERGFQMIIERLSSDGVASSDPVLEGYGVRFGFYDDVTGHNIAAPFWDLMNSAGIVWNGREFVEGQLFPEIYYATGRPVTEPYWSDVFVDGRMQPVLVQCFERRCLTYTPDNASGWQVEAGNVGLHYYQWRYQPVFPAE